MNPHVVGKLSSGRWLATVAVMLVFVFGACWQIVKGTLAFDGKDVFTVIVSVVSFYFGTRAGKQEQGQP